MSQLLKLLRTAGRTTSRPTAGFGSRQEPRRKRLVLVATLTSADVDAAKKAVNAGADAVELELDPGKLEAVEKLAKALDVPVGVAVSGDLPAGFDAQALENRGIDYVKVEAGDVPATIFLIDGVAVVLEVKQDFSDTMLKMLNFLPAKVVQVDSPDTAEGFTVKQLMEKRVDRELIGKPILMKVGASIRPAAAQLLALVAPNGLVVPAADVAAWSEAVAGIKDPSETDDEPGGTISLRAPVTAAS